MKYDFCPRCGKRQTVLGKDFPIIAGREEASPVHKCGFCGFTYQVIPGGSYLPHPQWPHL